MTGRVQNRILTERNGGFMEKLSKKLKIRSYFPPIFFTLFILFVWELYSSSGPSYFLFLPSPSAVGKAFFNNWDIILRQSAATVQETVIGFLSAVVLGIFFSLLISFSRMAKKTFYPLLIISQTIPMIALAPLLLIWFGYDLTPKIILVVLYCFFPITVAVIDALNNVDEDYLKLARSMNASPVQIFRLVRFPFSYPALFTGLKIAATYAVTGAIVGEFIGSYEGLGVLMRSAANSHASALVFASILMVVILSLLLFSLVSLAEKFFIPWNN